MSNDPKAQAKSDLIYAILALDSYNRGYCTGIGGLPEEGQIGSFTVGSNTDQTGWKDAGFYAIAYKNLDTGEVVISYRGTDAKLFGNDQIGGSDPVNAYGLALGNTQGRDCFASARPGAGCGYGHERRAA
ncbi:MAG: hypothetical protein P8Y48_16900 [Novosphingobium sp.]